MALTVRQVQCYGKHVDGSPLPYMAEVSEKTFKSGGNNYLLSQKKTDTGSTTKLYQIFDNDEKLLLREKLNGRGSILRDTYDLFGNKISASAVPKGGTGQFYFYDVKDGKFNKNWLSGHLYKGELLGSPTNFGIAKRAGKSAFWELGGGSKYMFDKVLKYLTKIRI